MVNEQLLKKLEKLIPNLENQDPQQWTEILVDKITQQENEIQDYQTQIANFKNQLEKKKPRRLSLSSQSSEDERGHDSSYPIMSPRLGSPYYDRPSPRRSGLSSPKTRSRPLSPAALQLGVIVETFNQKEQEIEESVNQVIGEFQDSENNLRSQINRLKKQLSQKDNELGRAESQRQVQEEEIERLRELNSKNNQAFTELKKENQQKETLIKKLESEAECAKTDTYYYDQKIKELEAKNREEKRDKEELEKKITHERQEKQLLKKKYEAADSSVAKRIQELEKFRKLSRHESEKLQKIIADKTEAWEKASKEQKKRHEQELREARTLWGESNKKSHSRSNSANFVMDEHENIIFNLPKNSLHSELSPHLAEPPSKGDFFGEEDKKRKHRSVPLPPKAPLTQRMAFTLCEMITRIENNQPVCNLEEHYQLEERLKSLEASTQSLNQELLEWKNVKKKDWEHQLAQANYELQEAKSGQRNLQTHLAQAESRISELEDELRQRENQLNQDKENLSDELESVKNERNSQRKVLANLAGNMSKMKMKEAEEITDKQLTNPLTSLKNSVREFGAEIQEAQILINNWNLRNKSK